MSTNGDQFVIDDTGNKTAVLVRIDRYSELLEAQEELESTKPTTTQKPQTTNLFHFAEAVKEIENESSITMKLPDDTKSALNDAANEDGLPENALVEKVVADYLFIRRFRTFANA